MQPNPSQPDPTSPTQLDPDPDQWEPAPSPGAWTTSPSPSGPAGDGTGAYGSPGTFTQGSTDGSGDGGGRGGASLERMTKNGLTEAAGHAFAGVGKALNTICAEDRQPHQEPDEIWLPTDDERDGVAKPVGRILARKVPDLPGGKADDAGDLIAAAIPLGIWLVRGLSDLVPRHVGKHRRGRQPSPDQAAEAAQQ